MILDYFLNFGIPDITNSTAKTASTNVYDAGADVILFGSGHGMRAAWKTVITADASPTIRIDIVGSDNVDLDPNDNETQRNVILGSSGIVLADEDGTALASGDTIEGVIALVDQVVSRQYYGGLITLGGTNPDVVAATSFLKVVNVAQTNLRGPRAAIPA